MRKHTFIIGGVASLALFAVAQLITNSPATSLVEPPAAQAPALVFYPGYPINHAGAPTAVYGFDTCPAATWEANSQPGCIRLDRAKVPVRYMVGAELVQDEWTVTSVDGLTTIAWRDGSPVVPWSDRPETDGS